MVDTQTAGAGIRPRIITSDPIVEEQMRKHLPHDVFSPGETLALGDRQLSAVSIPQGRLTLIESHSYLERNRSTEYIKGEDKNEFITYTKTALDSAREVISAFMSGEMFKAFIINALTGVSPDKAIQIESILVPELPSSLKKLAQYLLGESRRNIESAGLQGEDAELAEAVRKEMIDATKKVIMLQSTYLDRTERELINSRKPNGKGKSSLDGLDRHYYRMLERKMPLESDLDFVAEQEIKNENPEASPTGSFTEAVESLKQIAQAIVGQGPAVVQPSEEVAELRAELKETQERFNRLLEMVESGEVKPKKKSA